MYTAYTWVPFGEMADALYAGRSLGSDTVVGGLNVLPKFVE